MTASNAEVAALWAKGLSGDWSILERLSSPVMRVWHSHDNMWLTREESAARMAESTSPAASAPPSFDDVRTTASETGFVVQCSVRGLTGESGRTHIVQICTVEDGLVASCEEFIAPESNLD
jgi:hypothetical protein